MSLSAPRWLPTPAVAACAISAVVRGLRDVPWVRRFDQEAAIGSGGLAVATDLHLAVAQDGAAFTIILAGEIDLANCEKVLSAARLVLTSEVCEAITIDLDEVTFLDCAGLSALIAISEKSKERPAIFEIVNAHAPIRRLIELSNLNAVLTIR